MKKFLMCLALVITIFSFTACNYNPIDLTYNYNYAIIKLPNGEIVEGKVEAWTDYEGEQLQVCIDGKTYLTSSYNCVMIANY